MQEALQKLETAILLPFQAVIGRNNMEYGDKRIYWAYLISSTFLALFIYFQSKRKESLTKYLFNKKIWLSKSALIDYCYIFFNSLIKVFILSAIINWGKYLAFYTQDFLLDLGGYTDYKPNIALASALFLVSFTLIEDLFSFLIHWLHHKIPFLWQFHKVHHSATVLNPITQYRIHPIELFFNNISHLLAFGLTQGVFSWLYFDDALRITTISTNIFALIFFIWGANLRHSHVRLAYFSWIENIFISPYQHQIHHSDNPIHFNKNMGSKFALWDKLFGTLVKSKDATHIKFGLGDENKDFDNFLKTLFFPFLKLFKKQ